MRDCPQCGAHVDGLRCAKCGFTEPGAVAGADPFRWRCADYDRGLRCADAGTLSSSTTGSGPWYCAQHLPPFRAATAVRANRPYGLQRLGEIARQLAPRQPGPEAAAERAAIEAES